MEEITSKWQRNWEILDIYYKHYCNRMVSMSKEILEDPEFPVELKPSMERFYKMATAALTQAYNSPLYPRLLERIIEDNDVPGHPGV